MHNLIENGIYTSKQGTQVVAKCLAHNSKCESFVVVQDAKDKDKPAYIIPEYDFFKGYKYNGDKKEIKFNLDSLIDSVSKLTYGLKARGNGVYILCKR